MTPERWAQVRTLLESALEEEPARRTAFLQQACNGDGDLLLEVRKLLESFEKSPDFLSTPIPVAAELRRATLKPDALEGASVGHWKLLRRVGSGGMAVVYAGSRADHEFQKIVAIKIVKPGMDSEEILRRFRNERQVLASLEHPNIARLLDGGTTEYGLPYLVMEYVEGIPIDQYCDKCKLSVAERLVLFRTVCSAVQYAHQNLVVHRDLKPSNILVTADGVPKLLDFGIAKLLRPEYSGESVQLTRTAARLMTPEYASPEQIRGDPITTASDVYSLGVLLYHLLTGDLPHRFEHHTTAEIEQAICHSEPELPSVMVAQGRGLPAAENSREKLQKRLRGDLDMIVITALCKEPQRRYASAERFSDDLLLHLRGAPVSARKASWSYRTNKFVRRHRLGVVVATVLVLSLIAGAAISAYFANVAGKQKEMTLQLAAFMLGDFDAAMESGVTSARRASMEKVLASLNELSPNAAGDPSLRALLVKAYLKVGDLQGNVYESNLGDAEAARRSYQQAQELARAAGLKEDLAIARLKLADCDFDAGDRKSALEGYNAARTLLEQIVQKHGAAPAVRLTLARIWYKMGITQSQLGDLSGALASYMQELQLSERWADLPGAGLDDRRQVALSEEHVGNMLVTMGDGESGQLHLERSLEIYKELLSASPSDINLRVDIAVAFYLSGEALNAAGHPEEAETRYRTSVEMFEKLEREDPNERYRRYLNRTRNALADALVKLGKMPEARRMTQDLVADLRSVLNRPQVSVLDLYEYCWAVLTTPFKDLQDPGAALHQAQRAVELTHAADPGILDVLARGYAVNGELKKAIETDRQALGLLPAKSGLKRSQVEENLARFEQELKEGAHSAVRDPK